MDSVMALNKGFSFVKMVFICLIFIVYAMPVQAEDIPPSPIDLVQFNNSNYVNNTYWIDYYWSAGSGIVTDSYNISLNDVWTNGTIDTFLNVSVGVNIWYNLSVYAFNSSFETLSNPVTLNVLVQEPHAINRCGIAIYTGYWDVVNNLDNAGNLGSACIRIDTSPDVELNGNYYSITSSEDGLGYPIHSNDGNNITIRNFEMFNIEKMYVDNTKFSYFSNISIHDNTGNGLFLTSVSESFFENITITNTFGGIYFDSGDYDNTFIDMNLYGNPIGDYYLNSALGNVFINSNFTGDLDKVVVLQSTSTFNMSQDGQVFVKKNLTSVSPFYSRNGTWSKNEVNWTDFFITPEDAEMTYNISGLYVNTDYLLNGVYNFTSDSVGNGSFIVNLNDTQTFVLTKTINYYVLNGYVINVLGAPLNNARIDLNNSYVFTDNTGYYQFNNTTEGIYTILLRGIGYKNQSVSININDNSTYNFTMQERTGTGRGYVVQSPGFEILFVLLAISLIYLKKRGS